MNMAQMSYTDAIWSAIREEMRINPRILVMGQDVELDAASARQEFGDERIRSTPISEAGFIGAGIGAALTDYRAWMLYVPVFCNGSSREPSG
jgi:acetoin:2,6-dichlorophenolindophenol oxidoreductase subunit beta